MFWTWLVFIISILLLIIVVQRGRKPGRVNIAFFHPHCNAGGGGERVLWATIEALQMKYDSVECAIYCIPGLKEDDLINSVFSKFKIKIENITLVPIKSHFLLDKKYYPHLTVLAQHIASILVGTEAFLRMVPDIFIDTTGFPFTAVLFKLFSKTAAYVHYPIVSSDMVDRVRQTSWVKVVYYKMLMVVYGIVGGCFFDCVMVNSNWTRNHILKIWGNPKSTWLLYPPCATNEFSSLPVTRGSDQRFVAMSLAQFRPEKNLKMQILAINELLKLPTTPRDKVLLKLVGGVRNEEDKALVDELKYFAEQLGIEDNIIFCENVTFDGLKEILSSSSIGLHSMVDEHFGIGIVECMAAGLIMVAHNSGGPKLDIILDDSLGFRAESINEYAEKIKWIMSRSPDELNDTRRNAREWAVGHFSEDIYRHNFIQIFDSALL